MRGLHPYWTLFLAVLIDCLYTTEAAGASGAGAPSTAAPPPPLYLYTNDIPLWLQVLLGITACCAALLLLTCLLLCCMRLCGCWTGNILGVGALRRPIDDTDHIGCWCCRPHYVSSRDDGQISYRR